MAGDRANDTEQVGPGESKRAALGQVPVARVRLESAESPSAGNGDISRSTRRSMRSRPVGEILVAHGKLGSEQLRTVLRQQVQLGGRVGELLVEQGLVDEADVVRALSEQTGIPFVSESRVAAMPVPAEAVGLLPAEHAERLGALPLSLRGKQLFCAMRDPRDLGALDEIQFRAGVPSVQGVYATQGAIRRGQRRFYHGDLDRQAEVWESVGSVELPPEVPPALLLDEVVPPAAAQLRERLVAALLERRGAIGRTPSLVRRLAQRFGATPPETERAVAAAELLVLLAPPAAEGFRMPDAAAMASALGEAAESCRDLLAAAAGEVPTTPAAAAFAAAITLATAGGPGRGPEERSATG